MLDESFGKYRIQATPDNNGYRIVLETTTEKGKYAERTVGYFNSIESAIKRMAEIHAMQKDTLYGFLLEYQRVVRNFEDTIHKALGIRK